MEYIYKTVPVERLQIEENWTDEDNQFTSDHFQYLLDLKAKGQLVIAGKTDGLDDTTYGIVVFKADNDEEAQSIMENDPAIKNHVMIGTLHKYSVAIFNKDYTK